MAGTLTISTLSDGTNSTSSTNCIQGSSKAWVNFNGTGTPAIRASYNVSSISRIGTGQFTINFTTAFADTNYAAIGQTDNAEAYSPAILTFATTSVRMIVYDSGYRDPAIASVTCFR